MEGMFQVCSRLRSQGAKLEVESVVRETAEKVLSEPGVPKEKLAMRAVALDMMAEVSLTMLRS